MSLVIRKSNNIKFKPQMEQSINILQIDLIKFIHLKKLQEIVSKFVSQKLPLTKIKQILLSQIYTKSPHKGGANNNYVELNSNNIYDPTLTPFEIKFLKEVSDMNKQLVILSKQQGVLTKQIQEQNIKLLNEQPIKIKEPSEGLFRKFTNAFSTTIFMSLINTIFSLLEFSSASYLLISIITGTNLGIVMPLLFGLYWFVKKCLNINVSNLRQIGECGFSLILLSIALGNSEYLVEIKDWLYEQLTKLISPENLLNIKNFLNDTIGTFFNGILSWTNKAYYYSISWIPLGPPVIWNNLEPHINWDEWGMYGFYQGVKEQFTAFDTQFQYIFDSINSILEYIKRLKDMTSMPDKEQAKEALKTAGRKAGEKINDAAEATAAGLSWVARGAKGLIWAGNQAANQAEGNNLIEGHGLYNNNNMLLGGSRRSTIYSKHRSRDRRGHRRRKVFNMSHIHKSKAHQQLQKKLHKSNQRSKHSKKGLNVNYEDINLNVFANNINSIRSTSFKVIGMLLDLDMVEHSHKHLNFNEFKLWQKLRSECMNLLKSLNKVHLMLNKNTDPELEDGLINLYETYRFAQFNKNKVSELFNLRALRNGRMFVHQKTRSNIPFTFTFMETNKLNKETILRKHPLVLEPPKKLSAGISKKSRKNKSRKKKSRKKTSKKKSRKKKSRKKTSKKK